MVFENLNFDRYPFQSVNEKIHDFRKFMFDMGCINLKIRNTADDVDVKFYSLIEIYY